MKCGLVVFAIAIACAALAGCSLSRGVIGTSDDARVGIDGGGLDARPTDAGTDARGDASIDAGHDAGDDVGVLVPDGGMDAGNDGGNDAGSDGGNDGGSDAGNDAPDSNGHACTSGATCATGQCVDGVCCASACAGLCQHCNGATPGTCSPIATGTDPDDECATQSASTCGTTGSCNGAGACERYDARTQCALASCTGGSATSASNCDGTGTCVAGSVTSCAPYICGANACLTICSSNGDCVAGDHCNASGLCAPPEIAGTPCLTGVDCASTFCVDGVCCNTSCAGTCQACSAARRGGGSDGVCGTIEAGRDPDNECATQSASTCGTTGSCDGSGACALYPIGTQCISASCTGVVANSAATCNGTGACGAQTMTSCVPYACMSGTCGTSCGSNTDCASGDYCFGSACVPKLSQGAACIASTDCTSANCIDGVCCNTLCAGLCQACSAARTGLADGLCSPITSGTDPDNECTQDAVSTCGHSGSCDGTGVCGRYPTGTACGVSCSSGVLSGAACDGIGDCVSGTGPMTSCAPYACSSATACGTSCVVSTDCAAPDYCSGGLCVPKLAQGLACGSNTDCAGGNCVDGVCCSSACAGTCQACNGGRTGQSDGTCADITNGTDPDHECSGLLACFFGSCA